MRSVRTLFLILAVVLGIVRPAVAGPALVFEPSTGVVIYSDDADRQWHPASLTKILTAYVVFDAVRRGELTLEDKIPMSATARKAPWGIGWPVGTPVPVGKALEALMVRSANDSAVLLAEKVSGSTPVFMKRMNDVAQRLGMTRSFFINPHGLHDPKQVTTARDMAILTTRILKDFPEHAAVYSQQFVRIGSKRVRARNRNFLRSFAGADGIKTGFVCASGFNVVASATQDGRQLVAVVLGEPTYQERVARGSELLQYAFDNYDWKLQLFPMRLDSLPVQASVPATDIRKSVRQWACGYRSARRISRRRRVRRKRVRRTRARRVRKKRVSQKKRK